MKGVAPLLLCTTGELNRCVCMCVHDIRLEYQSTSAALLQRVPQAHTATPPDHLHSGAEAL